MKQSKVSTKSKGTKKRAKRRPFPYEKVAAMWSEGKTLTEIATAIGRVGKGKDPYHALRVSLTKMHAGWIDENGKQQRLPHRISRRTLVLSKKAGLKAKHSKRT